MQVFTVLPKITADGRFQEITIKSAPFSRARVYFAKSPKLETTRSLKRSYQYKKFW